MNYLILLFHFIFYCFIFCSENDIVPNDRRIIIWLGCVTDCGDIPKIIALKDYISGVAKTDYIINNGSLVYIGNRTTYISDTMHEYGLEYYSLVGSSDLNQMRIIFNNPNPFVEQLLMVVSNPNITGINMDFECGDPQLQESDGVGYFNLLVQIQTAFDFYGKKLTVDFNSDYGELFWIPSLMQQFVQNYNGHLVQMQTYQTLNGNLARWDFYLLDMKNYFGTQNMGVGLDVYCYSNQQMVLDYFEQVCAYGFNEIYVFDSPFPSYWNLPIQQWNNLTNCIPVPYVSNSNQIQLSYHFLLIILSFVF